MRIVILILLVNFIVISSVSAAAPFIESKFSVDDEGWTDSGAAITYEKPGGNHGGYLKIEDTADDTYSIFLPSKFTGDLSQFNGGFISYDLLLINPLALSNSSIGSGFGSIQLLGGGSNATFRYAEPPIPSSESWTSYYVPLKANAWDTSEENWNNVLSNVTSASITFDSPGQDIVGLDNYKVAAVPEPATLLLIGGGFAGALWRRRKVMKV